MVEKGTPGGIINDAGRFLDWHSSQTLEDLTRPRDETVAGKQETNPTTKSPTMQAPGQLPADASGQGHLSDGEKEHQEGAASNNNGVYGILSSALGMASSAVASRVAAFAPASLKMDHDGESSSSNVSIASADGDSASHDASLANKDNIAADGTSARSSVDSVVLSETGSQGRSSEPSPPTGLSQAQSHQEKELRKLQNRMRKAQEKLERAQGRRRAKHGNGNDKATDVESDTAGVQGKDKDKENDDQALAKLREKHEREIARQEEKYRRELQRLVDKRAAEREEKANLVRELERARAERDAARKEAEILRERVSELQRQNTRLVAKLGREGVDVEGLEGLRKEVL
ncbi:hypothetical protein VTG60DRAFT_4644 [Thermothelomyces hinnuleus]